MLVAAIVMVLPGWFSADTAYAAQPTTSRGDGPGPCGNEGQRVCWAAAHTIGGVAYAADWEATFPGGAHPCDRGLRVSGVLDTSTCIDGLGISRRHRLSSGSWQAWALDQQTNGLGADEPVNWVARLGTHNAFNSRADTYPFPNQEYSLSDQLNYGSRTLALDEHWSRGHLRLAHATSSCGAAGQEDPVGGCSGDERLYFYGIEEIANWLNKAENSDTVIILSMETYANDKKDYMIDPIKYYLGDKVLKPAEWCAYLNKVQRTNTCATSRWPTYRELRTAFATPKQVLISSGGSGNVPDNEFGGEWIFDMPGHGLGAARARNFNGTSCTSDGTNVRVFDTTWSVLYEERVLLAYTQDEWPGYLYAYQVPSSGGTQKLDQGATIQDATGCNVSVSLDYLGSDNCFDSGTVCMSDAQSLKDRREAAIWSWAKDDWGQGGACALYQSGDARFHSKGCTETHRFACAKVSRTDRSTWRSGDPLKWTNQAIASVDWKVTTGTGVWSAGWQTCLNEFGGGWVYAVPVNGAQAAALKGPAGSTGDLWLAYTRQGGGGAWAVGGPTPAVACRISPDVIYPPNNRTVQLLATVTETEWISGTGVWELNRIETDDGHNPTEVSGFSYDMASFRAQLRASIIGTGPRRTYTFVYIAASRGGRTSECRAQVIVPYSETEFAKVVAELKAKGITPVVR